LRRFLFWSVKKKQFAEFSGGGEKNEKGDPGGRSAKGIVLIIGTGETQEVKEDTLRRNVRSLRLERGSQKRANALTSPRKKGGLGKVRGLRFLEYAGEDPRAYRLGEEIGVKCM